MDMVNVPTLLAELEELRRERELVSAGLVVHDARGVLLYSNSRASRLLGLTHDQLAGKQTTDPYWQFLFADGTVMPVERYPVSIVASTLKPLEDYVVGVVRGRGQAPAWLLCNAYPEFDGAELRRIVVSFVDISALHQNRQQLALALQAGSLGDWSWDIASDVVHLSERAALVLGVEDGRSITWTQMRENLHPDDREPAAAAVLKAVGSNATYDIEYRVRIGNELRWVAAQGRATYGAGAEPIGMIGIVQDITERKREQERAATEAEMLALLNRTGTTLAAELDLERLLQGVTDAATKLTGAQFGAFFYNGVSEAGEALTLYTLSGAPREAFEHFGHPRATPVFAPTFHGSTPVRIEDVHQDERYGRWGPHHGMPSGHLPVRSYLAVSVTSRSGEVLGGLFFGHPAPGVFTERSERLAVGVAAHAAVAIDNARLYAQSQSAAKERNQLLESERAARSEAERASRLKDQFLATLSHELRTPLSAITGWVHILRRSTDVSRETLVKGLDVIERSTKAQTELIEDLLDMSRITSGKLMLERQAIDAQSVVQRAIDVLQPTASAAKVELVARFAHQPVVVQADAARLEQVVWNLLSNAIKFSPQGSKVHIDVASTLEGQRIIVQDAGAGIAEEFLPHVFERFRQADGSTTRKFGGLGLGLSIARSLVELHGGTIAVASDGIGKGAKFTVLLPAAAPLPSLGTTSAHAPLHLTTASRGLRDIAVLLIDDEADALEVVARVFEEAGAHVKAVSSAPHALQAFAEQRFDVIVSDIGMPGMDGYSLIRRIRAAVGGVAVKAFALTAFARQEDRDRALTAGFDHHIAKPINPAELLDMVASSVQDRCTDSTGRPPAHLVR